jgi:hypothetical protein
MLKKKQAFRPMIELGSFQTCLMFNPQHMTPLPVAPSWLDNETSLRLAEMAIVLTVGEMLKSNSFAANAIKCLHTKFFEKI